MRQECRNFESRTYPNGETVRKCNLDLAPEAPWRCPDNCPKYEPRLDAGWTYGTVVAAKTPDEPPGSRRRHRRSGAGRGRGHLNAVGPQVMAEVQAEQALRRARAQVGSGSSAAAH